MRKSKAEAIVSHLLSNAAGLKYGNVSVTAKVHDGRIVEISYATTESTREPGEKRGSAYGGGDK
jgi:hypothetical protein